MSIPSGVSDSWEPQFSPDDDPDLDAWGKFLPDQMESSTPREYYHLRTLQEKDGSYTLIAPKMGRLHFLFVLDKDCMKRTMQIHEKQLTPSSLCSSIKPFPTIAKRLLKIIYLPHALSLRYTQSELKELFDDLVHRLLIRYREKKKERGRLILEDVKELITLLDSAEDQTLRSLLITLLRGKRSHTKEKKHLPSLEHFITLYPEKCFTLATSHFRFHFMPPELLAAVYTAHMLTKDGLIKRCFRQKELCTTTWQKKGCFKYLLAREEDILFLLEPFTTIMKKKQKFEHKNNIQRKELYCYPLSFLLHEWEKGCE